MEPLEASLAVGLVPGPPSLQEVVSDLEHHTTTERMVVEKKERPTTVFFKGSVWIKFLFFHSHVFQGKWDNRHLGFFHLFDANKSKSMAFNQNLREAFCGLNIQKNMLLTVTLGFCCTIMGKEYGKAKDAWHPLVFAFWSVLLWSLLWAPGNRPSMTPESDRSFKAGIRLIKENASQQSQSSASLAYFWQRCTQGFQEVFHLNSPSGIRRPLNILLQEHRLKTLQTYLSSENKTEDIAGLEREDQCKSFNFNRFQKHLTRAHFNANRGTPSPACNGCPWPSQH